MKEAEFQRYLAPGSHDVAMMTSTAHTIETAEYSVVFDPVAKTVRVALHGHWDMRVADRYEREFREGLRTMRAGGCPFGEQLAFVDLRDFAVQSQDVLIVLANLSNDPTIAPKRTAMVASSALLTMQARRVAPDYRTFSDPAQALAWLTGSD